jgi:uncharacterized protein (DUF2345 family)
MAEYTRYRQSGNRPTAGGPYEAIVVNHLDPAYMGTLEVELLKNTGSGNNPERTGQLHTVRYLSPFYGVTPNVATANNDGYEWTQKSYGFWAVPPDVGTKVLVIFAEENSAYGYWIGCIQDNFMNFMLPDGRASTELTTAATPRELQGNKLPVGEYNKRTESGAGKDPTKFLKPYNKDFSQILEIQGLITDEVRGTTTTSARREIPSMVFGMSTPGPLDKRPGAPRFPLGNEETKAQQFTNRLGGSSFVMDDGDDKYVRAEHPSEGPPRYVNKEGGESGGDPTLPKDEHVRLRTRTGHQILLHNTEDVIYIANARGTAWIELTSDGKIDIHAQDSISVMSNNDINFTAERDFNIEAGRNINMRADGRWGQKQNFYDGKENGRIQMESEFDTKVLVGQDHKITVKRKSDTIVKDEMKTTVQAEYNVHTLSTMYLTADNNMNLLSGVNMYETAGASHHTIAGGGSIVESASSNISMNAAGLIAMDASSIYADSGRSQSAASASPAEDAEPVIPLSKIQLPYVTPGIQTPSPYNSILTRAPQHEPWTHHENLNPQSFKINQTDREDPGLLREGINAITPDTFRKNSSIQSAALYSSGTSATANASGRGVVTQPTRDPLDPTIDRTTTARGQTEPVGAPLAESDLVGTVDGFDRAQTAAYLGAVGQRESNNRYGVVNSIGFAGKYQFGWSALVESGMLRSDVSPRSNSAMNNPANWTGQYGVNSLDDWLANVGNAQEYAMIEYTNKNRRYLLGNGGIRSTDTPEQIGGMLMGAHLLGAGGMNTWRRGGGGADAYGTTGDEYFALGSAALGGTATA